MERAMRLLVRGPAFGLPSIDAECIAAVGLLRLYAEDDWQLIPTHDDSSGLPLLQHDGRRFVGYAAIANHISGDQIANADSIALTSFLEANAQILLDVSLFVSFENYRNATRPAFTKILPWYANYITPPRLRSAARARTEHLGVSSIDVDNVHEDLSNNPNQAAAVGKQQEFEADAHKRASLLLPRKETVRSLLRRPEHAATFRLHTLAETFFAPLQDLLGEKQFLGGDEATKLDCLAYGYLSLMLYPEVPQDWLSSTLHRSYPRLVQYVERLDSLLRVRTCIGDVLAISKCHSSAEMRAHRTACHMDLPWCPPPLATLADNLIWTWRNLFEYFSPLPLASKVVLSTSSPRSMWERYRMLIIGFATASLGLGLHYAFRTGRLTWPHGEEVHIFGRKRFTDFGHLGSALAGVSILTREARHDAAFHEHERRELPVEVEVVGDL